MAWRRRIPGVQTPTLAPRYEREGTFVFIVTSAMNAGVHSARVDKPPHIHCGGGVVRWFASVPYGLTRFNGQSDGGNGTRGASPQLPRIIVRSAPSTFSSALMSAEAR